MSCRSGCRRAGTCRCRRTRAFAALPVPQRDDAASQLGAPSASRSLEEMACPEGLVFGHQCRPLPVEPVADALELRQPVVRSEVDLMKGKRIRPQDSAGDAAGPPRPPASTRPRTRRRPASPASTKAGEAVASAFASTQGAPNSPPSRCRPSRPGRKAEVPTDRLRHAQRSPISGGDDRQADQHVGGRRAPPGRAGSRRWARCRRTGAIEWRRQVAELVLARQHPAQRRLQERVRIDQRRQREERQRRRRRSQPHPASEPPSQRRATNARASSGGSTRRCRRS